MNNNFNTGYGQALLHAAAMACPTFGKIFVVCPSTDGNYNKLSQIIIPDPDGIARLFTSLEDAYAACTSNNDDVILLAANGSHTLTAGINWTKNRIHVVGLDGGGHLTDQGSKISSSSSDATGYVVKVTGIRNSFYNVKFIQNSTNAGALTVVQFGGEGNVYKKCSFIFGVVNNLGSTSANECVFGEDSGTFEDCEFGSDTLLTSAARAIGLIKRVNGTQEFKSNRFRRCTFKVSSSSSSALLLKVNAIADVLFTNLFEDCVFYASVDSAGGAAISNAVASASGLVKGTLGLVRPAAFNCTKVCAGVTDNVQVVGAANSSGTGVPSTPA